MVYGLWQSKSMAKLAINIAGGSHIVGCKPFKLVNGDIVYT
jgi:hypothetical protein